MIIFLWELGWLVCNLFVGVINGTWKVASLNGSIHFNDETFLIEIERNGFYSFYASVCNKNFTHISKKKIF